MPDDFATYSQLTEQTDDSSDDEMIDDEEGPYISFSFDLTDNWGGHDLLVQDLLDKHGLELDSGAGFGRRDYEGSHSLPEHSTLKAELEALNLPNFEIHLD